MPEQVEGWPPAPGKWSTVVGRMDLIDWGDGCLLPAVRVRHATLDKKARQAYVTQ